MKKYTFTWDRLTTWITVILSLVCLFLFYEGYRLFAYEEGSKGIGVFVIFMSAAILLVPIFFCPFYATKKEQTITIHFLAHRKILNLQQFEVEPQHHFSMSGWLRLCASGGYFGYWGIWRSKNNENIVSYLTNRKRDVYLLRPSSGNPIVINLPREWVE
ncbi:MAG: hypothetical protein II570_04795 [Bacteroidaceae bacterium]|jgi:hypothetical protein|nr:hypothetical protein [Bacteroidaceae bacterium]MBQ2166987.1 hypothetical protein [Bacteroidaceae bacterium]MBQ2181504.1 hypothetical protein [Bacteroidaceae bacterium]MBQ2586224.1 hypothetical protein [Bacteroidaceae bacterium]